MSFFSGLGKSRPIFQGLVLRKPAFSVQNLHFTDLLDPLADCTTKEASGWSLRLKVPQNSRGAGRISMFLSRVGKKSKLTAHQTKTWKMTLSCSSVNIFVQEIKENLTLEGLNKRQTRRARPSFPRSTPFSLLSSSNGRPISVTCQGSDCKFWTTFRSRAHGL